MKALVKYADGVGNVELREMPHPTPKDGEVIIEVKAAGICGTDMHIMLDGSYPIHPPVTLGHELSGVIAETCGAVGDLQVGMRVTSETYYHTCGHCLPCRTGRRNLCEDRLSIGSGVNGAMAKYVAVPASNVHVLPEQVGFLDGAMIEPMACCVQAVFEKTVITPGMKVLVSGPGTMGLLCVQLLRLFGCEVLVLGTRKDGDRLRLAETFGAAHTYLAEDADTIEQIRARAADGLGVDVAFECSGAGPAVTSCMNALRKGGTLVQVGLTGGPVPVDLNALSLREITIVGTFAQKSVWWDKSLQLLAQGSIDLKPLISGTYPLEAWEEGFNNLRAGAGFKHMLCPGGMPF